MELKTDRKRGVYLSVRTRSMGRCRCGSCWCNVFPDGTIQYVGGEAWQHSPRLSGKEADEPRPYHSELGSDGYDTAMREFRRIFKRRGSSVFVFEYSDIPSENWIYQVRKGRYRIYSRHHWGEWNSIENMPVYMNSFDVAVRFADRIARGEVKIPNTEDDA